MTCTLPTPYPSSKLGSHVRLRGAFVLRRDCGWSSWKKEGQMGRVSEDLVEPAGQELAGGASLRACC